MTRATIPNQPTVAEMLVSIRQAIHGGNAKPAPSGSSSGVLPNPLEHKRREVSGSMREMRVRLNDAQDKSRDVSKKTQDENFKKLKDQLHEMGAKANGDAGAPKTGRVPKFSAERVRKTPATGFAGILSGDMRLEEALQKLKNAGLQTAGDNAADERANRPRQAEPGAILRQSDVNEEEFEYEGQDSQLDEQYASETEYVPEQPVNQAQQHQPAGGYSDYTRETYLADPTPHQGQYQYPEESYEPDQHLNGRHADRSRSAGALPMAPRVPESAQPLTSQQATAATSAAFERLTEAIVGQASNGERSIDEITRELLRPMLQTWLDENLPALAERLVREEIERVARWGNK